MSRGIASEGRVLQDIRAPDLSSLDWAPEHARQSVDRIYQYMVETGAEAVHWYLTARRSKKRWAQRLRVGAIVMVAVASVLPVLSQIFSSAGSVKVPPAWATVALAIAFSLVALDRFFGFSSAWARYMTTGQAISAALTQFRLDWQKTSCRLSEEAVTQESIGLLLDLAKGLASKIDDLIQAETSQWTTEFRETLIAIERSTKA